MQLDDVEDALNNPPQKLKEYFDENGKLLQNVKHVHAAVFISMD